MTLAEIIDDRFYQFEHRILGLGDFPNFSEMYLDEKKALVKDIEETYGVKLHFDFMGDYDGTFDETKFISIAEYAKINNKSVKTIRDKCQRGGFMTAKKINDRCWVISENEPYTDLRKK